MEIVYLCDRKACETCNPDCKHTRDINHAVNFEKVGDVIYEKENQTKDIVNETVVALKKAGLMKNNRKSAFKKTEQLLRSYNHFIDAINLNEGDTVKTKKIVEMINKALIKLDNENPEYARLLQCIYFDNMTREELAIEYDCEPITITRNKNKLVNKLKDILFSDDVIEEIFL